MGRLSRFAERIHGDDCVLAVIEHRHRIDLQYGVAELVQRGDARRRQQRFAVEEPSHLEVGVVGGAELTVEQRVLTLAELDALQRREEFGRLTRLRWRRRALVENSRALSGRAN